MKRPRINSFFIRILFVFFLTIVVNIAVFSILIRYMGSQFINNLTDENIQILIDVIENSIVDDLYLEDYSRVENIFDEIILKDSGITSCKIYDRNGVLIALGGTDDLSAFTYVPEEMGLEVLTNNSLYINTSKDHKIIGRKFVLAGQILGGVVIDFNNDMINAQMKRILLILAGSSLLIILGGGLLFSLIIHQISYPLLRLSRIMKRYGEEDFELDFTYERDDEIKVLSDSLKTMSFQVKSSFEKLRMSEERFNLAVNGSKDGIWDYNPITNLFYMSSRCRQILGLIDDTEMKGLMSWIEIVASMDKNNVRDSLKDLIKMKHEFLDVEYRVNRNDGRMVWVRTRGKGLYNEKGQCIKIAGSLSDISHQKNNEERLVKAALYDPLTKLPNRMYLLERLHQEVETCKRKPDQNLAILYLDYDGFKRVNDTYGHAVGDLLLKAIASRLEKCVRSQDMACRIGGDEFVILLVDCGMKAQITEVVDRILQASSREFNLKDNSVFLTVSIGITMNQFSYYKLEDLIQCSDIAMYHAKNSGKGTYCFFQEDMQNKISKQWKIQNDLHKAINNAELFLVYQPIISLVDMQITGAEVLTRWQHPSRGLISPIDFIPQAEDSAFITQITDWLLQELKNDCSSTLRFNENNLEDIRISFNISSKDFICNPNILFRIKNTFTECKKILSILDIEVTETSLIDNFEEANLQLKALKYLGMKVKLDDFGTGYSSLNYLHSFSLDTIKIDRSFVCTLPENKENLNIIKHIIYLAHDLGLEVVAEGIETREQHEALLELGCDQGQGYLYSHPIAVADFYNLIIERRKSSFSEV